MTVFPKIFRSIPVLFLVLTLCFGAVSVPAEESLSLAAYREVGKAADTKEEAEEDNDDDDDADELLIDPISSAVSSNRYGAVVSDYNETLQGGGLAIPHYSQIASVTNGDRYNIGIDLGYSCAAFCMAMVQSYFLDRYVSPTAIWEDYAMFYTNQNNDGHSGGSGQAIFLNEAGDSSAGMPSYYIPASSLITLNDPDFKKTVKKAIKANRPVILQTGSSLFSTGQHFIVIRGYEEVEEEIEEEEESSSSESSESSKTSSKSSDSKKTKTSDKKKTKTVTYYYVNDPGEGYNGKENYESRRFTAKEILSGANAAYIFPAARVTRYNDPEGKLFYGRTETDKTQTVLQGNDSYQTAAYIARKSFPNGATRAVLISGEDDPVALTANAYAGAIDAPLILSGTGELAFETRNLLTNVWHNRVTEVTIIGKDFSNEVITGLMECGVPAEGIHVIGGTTRLETAEEVCRALCQKTEVKTVILASVEDPAQALAASGFCYKYKVPVLLVRADGSLTNETAALLKSHPKWKVLALGDKSHIKASALKGITCKRISGEDVYETCLTFNKYVKKTWDLGTDGACCALGEEASFTDALIGGMLAAKNNAAILLVGEGSDSVYEKLSSGLKTSGYTITVLGEAADCRELMALLPSSVRF